MWLPFLTNYIQVANCIFTIITAITVYILLPIFYENHDFIQLNVYYLATLFSCGILVLCIKKCCPPYAHENQRLQIKISFGAVTLCGVAAKYWVFARWDGDLLSLFYAFVTFNLVTRFFYIPAQNATGKFQLPYRKNYRLIILVAVIHIVSLVLGIAIALDFKKNLWQIISFQVYYSFVTASLVDLGIALTEGIEDYVEPPDRNILINPTVSCACPICMREYCDQVIPRILTKCGHTFCQECAQNLRGNTDKILCPNCRQETIVNGSVEALPKNFALLDAMRGNV